MLTAAGYAVFRCLDASKFEHVLDPSSLFTDSEFMNRTIQLEKFVRFEHIKDALAAASELIEGRISKKLNKVLKKLYVKELNDDILAVADKKLSQEINVPLAKLQIPTLCDSSVHNLMRAIRAHLHTLLPNVDSTDMGKMRLGLAHSLDRYKLKCNPDKVDTMIVQAVGLLDELDKESNNYIMRAKEMYGWHFPELTRIVEDNLTYINLVNRIGTRENVKKVDLSDLIDSELISHIKDAAIVSLGTEITSADVQMIRSLCDQVCEVEDSRKNLQDYLVKRMVAVAPNLTAMVGEILGARLIARAGTLVNLAKHPASTVQIMGAEKALFRALKNRHNTPKYGILYHASLVSQADTQFKGKISRMLAAKAALSIRLDAFGEDDADKLMGSRSRAYLEERLRQLESGT
ncbi:unnamed protein product, partial [Protopolystoma xenopodis]